MAKHSHDDDQAKKSNGAKTPKPKPKIPNMSLDEPVEAEPLEAEEVLEEAVPVAEEAHEEAEEVLAAEEVEDAEPIEEADEIEEADALEEAEPIAEEVAEEVAEAEPIEEAEEEIMAAEPVAEAEPEEVDLVEMMEEDAPRVKTEKPTHSFAELASASAPVEPIEDAEEIEEPVEEAEEIEEAVAEEIAEAEEVAEAEPVSGVKREHVVHDDAPGVSASPSDIVTAHEPVEMASKSDVIAAHEPVHAAPASDVVHAHEPVAHGPTEDAAPVSDVAEAEEVIEDAAPISDVAEAEEVAEAAPESDVLFDEAVGEAMPASEMESAEEIAEAAEEVSSATRKSEAVLEDEVAEEAEPVSAESEIEEAVAEEVLEGEAEPVEAGSSVVLSDVSPVGSSAVKKPASGAAKTESYEQTMAYQAPASGADKADDEMLVTEEEMAGSAEASAVDLGDMPARKGSSVTGIDKVAEALESGVDLGSGPGDSADPSEQLAATVPSVEFDELLDDDSVHDAKPAKKKAAKEDDFDTEMDAAIAEEAEEAEEKAPKKKSKKDVAAEGTGEEPDLDALFGEAESEEAEAEEADEAEAAEFDEETEAAEAFADDEGDAAEADEDAAEAAEALDGEPAEEAEAAEALAEEDEKPKKKTRAGEKTAAEDEEEALADEDEADLAAKKKKKKGKEKATVAPAQSGGFLRILIGGMVASFLIVVCLAAGWFLAPDQLHDVLKMSSSYNPPPKVPEQKPHVFTSLESAHKEMDQGKFQEAVKALADAKEPAELSTRGEAQWLAYYQEQTDKKAPLDANSPQVKQAVKDLTDAKNDAKVAQIRGILGQSTIRDDLAKAIADKGNAEKALQAAEVEKAAAEKRVEAARDVLVKGNYIKKNDTLEPAVLQKVLKSLSDDKAALDAVNAILDDGKFKPGEEGVKEILAKKKDADDAVAAVNKVLEDEKIKDQGVKGVLKIVDARNAMTKERDSLVKTIGDAFRELVDGKIVKDGGDPVKDIVAGTKVARLKAESPLAIPLAQLSMTLGSVGAGTGKVIEQSFDMAKVFSELGYYRGREPFVQSPEQKLNTHIALLQDRKRNDPKELAAITREADWVRSPESKANAESRAKARYVQGLALRNQEKFAEAKAAFTETVGAMSKISTPDLWIVLAQRSQKELTDPKAYYIPRMAVLQAEGKLAAALAEADAALKAIPGNSRLFAERGSIRVAMIHGQGPKKAEAASKGIRSDADEAAKDSKLAAEAAYIVGLLEEELGNFAEAEKQFRQAITLHPATEDDVASKYRVALARLLLRDRVPESTVVPPPADEKKKDDKTGAFAPVSPTETTTVLHPWTPLLLSAAIAQGQPSELIDDKETIARLNETLKLAEELIASKNDKIRGQGLILRGSALSKLGKRTEGLKDFTNGLKLVYPGMETKEMTELVADHPAFQQPDTSGTPNPIMAEKHFGEGIHHYWANQYPQAEAQFRQAVKFYDKDARYHYYLGLSQLQQKTKAKRDSAVYAFEQGARLEAKMASINPDAVREINTSLERIQGELRQYLNAHRYRAMTPDIEEKDAK